MRTTSLLRILLALQDTVITGLEFSADALIVDVKPTWRRVRCGQCHRKGACAGGRTRKWRHLDLGGLKCELRYHIRRTTCRYCDGVKTEHVPWAAAGSRFTKPFEMHTAYLAQRTDKTTVTRLMRISWTTVGALIERVVARQRGDVDRLDGLRWIGVDELSYRRHHEYITVVINHETGQIVWAAKGKSAATLKQFFEQLGPKRLAKLEGVTIDMSGAYIKAITEAAPETTIIFDRFHVQRLASTAVDQVRRQEVNLADAKDKKALKRTRWALLKNPWKLSDFETRKLTELQRTNRRIYRAYLLKQALGAVLDSRTINVARAKLDEWLAWASRSRLRPFVSLARTLRQYREGILEYVRDRLNNGRIEGLNGKARVITRRAYGFHSAASLIAMLFLCCGGVLVGPAQISPGLTY